MAVVGIITDAFGTDNFTDYEQGVYDRSQKRAEDEIIAALDTVLSSISQGDTEKKGVGFRNDKKVGCVI